MNWTRLAALTLTLSGAAFAAPALAQWSSDPANNFKLADSVNDQIQPKIAATPDGGAYVSWFDNATGGYDVTIQRVNARGVEQWAHNGLLVADRTVSSTVDYSLACDLEGNAVIVFNDSRTAPAQITLQKIAPDGTFLFNGTAGINVGPGSTTSSPPTVAILADGNYGVIWNNSAASPINTAMQKVDAHTGALLWNGGAPVIQTDWLSPVRPVQASDCQADDVGGMIVLFVRCTGTNCVTSNKQLFSQRYNALGAPVWNVGTPVTIFASTFSIQTATFPRFIPDGSGGAVYGWYENGSARNAYIQHVLGSGLPKFPAPIANTGVTAGRIRTGAGLAYDRATGSYYLASSETDSGSQSQNSVFVQKFDSLGNRLWSDTGVTIVPITNTSQPSFIQAHALGDDVVVSFMETRSATTRVISAARVNHNGGIPSLAWYFQPNSDSGTDKSRLTSALSTCGGSAMLAYGWGATGGTDIGLQNVLLDGTIGPGTCPVFTNPPPIPLLPCQGSNISITVAATGNSAPCYQWRKNGVNLSNGGRFSGVTSTTLTITNVQGSDAGSYDAVASNTCGDQTSAPTPVTICAADYNCDHVLSVPDIFDFLAAWFASNPNADFNRNGQLNVNDIFDFLAAWFAGC